MPEAYLSCFRASNGLTAIRLLASPTHYSSTRIRKGAAVATRERRLLQHGLGTGGNPRAGGAAVIVMFGGWGLGGHCHGHVRGNGIRLIWDKNGKEMSNTAGY